MIFAKKALHRRILIFSPFLMKFEYQGTSAVLRVRIGFDLYLGLTLGLMITLLYWGRRFGERERTSGAFPKILPYIPVTLSPNMSRDNRLFRWKWVNLRVRKTAINIIWSLGAVLESF